MLTKFTCMSESDATIIALGSCPQAFGANSCSVGLTGFRSGDERTQRPQRVEQVRRLHHLTTRSDVHLLHLARSPVHTRIREDLQHVEG